MTGNDEREGLPALRETLGGAARIEVHPLDVADACRQYVEDGYEVTDLLREFLAAWGELTVTWQYRERDVVLTTAVGPTLEAAHATPRNLGIFGRRLGRRVALVGTVFDTEEAVLITEDGDVLLAGDVGFQRVANGFAEALRRLVAADYDRTFFWPDPPEPAAGQAPSDLG
ncbi:SUKH-3 domain-containing protein [Kitasatospora cineracea]|uniref:SUKH-3 immunity protein of toxin-antitoxin system n=1 Tax=Kitasatospora cineracea TaxID=88074 RepID=A0A3N4RUM8_9ACTN|nr:SUKH-3 domain-containing protein [Kitasatospora cineracea]RPE32067.1 SUKH-3 immunity protein of toxin-antitoxin system [Kitasatospora cineracea]